MSEASNKDRWFVFGIVGLAIVSALTAVLLIVLAIVVINAVARGF